jgi:hypothetical protein
MGAPDDFVLPSRYNDAYKAMGDGVVVPVVSWLSDHLLQSLARLSAAARTAGAASAELANYCAKAEKRALEWLARIPATQR